MKEELKKAIRENKVLSIIVLGLIGLIPLTPQIGTWLGDQSVPRDSEAQVTMPAASEYLRK